MKQEVLRVWDLLLQDVPKPLVSVNLEIFMQLLTDNMHSEYVSVIYVYVKDI